MKTEWEIFIESILNPPEIEHLPAPRGGNPIVSAAVAIPFCLLFMYCVWLAAKALLGSG